MTGLLDRPPAPAAAPAGPTTRPAGPTTGPTAGPTTRPAGPTTGPTAGPTTGPAAEPGGSGAGPVLRPAQPGDREAVRAFLAGLSLETAYRRFFTGLGSPSASLVRHLVDVDHDRRESVLALVDGQVAGLADTCRLQDGATVEIGVVVADRWQRRGLGPLLTRAVLDLAAARGARAVRIHALADNERVARLVRRGWPDGVPARDGTALVWDLPLPRLDDTARAPTAAAAGALDERSV